MRVTNQMIVSGSLHRLRTRLESYERIQSELSSGRRILRPSDDPGGTARVLALRTSLDSREQELRNAADARTHLDLADDQLQSAMNRLQRARELVVRGSSSLGGHEREAIAAELETIRDEIVGIANVRTRGRPLFAGFRDVDAVAQVAGTWTYQGDDGQITRRVSEGDVVPVNVTASAVFGFGTPEGDTFTAMDDAIASIRAGDTSATAASIVDLDAARHRVGDALALVGANRNRVDAAAQRAEDARIAIRTQISQTEDVEYTSAIMDAKLQQVALEATLRTLAEALPTSLVSFLR